MGIIATSIPMITEPSNILKTKLTDCKRNVDLDKSEINEEVCSSRILRKKDFLSSPMGVEPMTFKIPVGHSNH